MQPDLRTDSQLTLLGWKRDEMRTQGLLKPSSITMLTKLATWFSFLSKLV